jgi:hypothetical protein
VRGDLGSAGSVAVDPWGVGVHWHLGPVARNHFALHDSHGLLRCFVQIVDERVGGFAGAQGAAGFIAVGEGFRANASQDSTDAVFNVLEHKQVWRCEQLLLLKQ